MDIQGFQKVVERLAENASSWGNDILYNMAKNSDLTETEQLAGAMWLIGTSYSASPQRRSYKSWMVRPNNDGRGQFFDQVADFLNKDPHLPSLQKDIGTFQFDGSDQEMDLLIKSIELVLQFDACLCKAIEKFDGATDKDVCTHHISFCSKFLHFYHPHSVFIIDRFALQGGKDLFSRKKGIYICDPENDHSYNPLHEPQDCFDDSLGKTFRASDVKKYVEKVKENLPSQLVEAGDAYIPHCVRSYLLGCWLKNQGIPLGKQASIPRLADTVFLNLKAPLPSATYENGKPKNERAILEAFRLQLEK